MAMASIIIEDRHLIAAGMEAGCTYVVVRERLEAMYRANLHEDLKWVIEDILEVGV